jgi:hypothetical protein
MIDKEYFTFSVYLVAYPSMYALIILFFREDEFLIVHFSGLKSMYVCLVIFIGKCIVIDGST